MLQLASSDLSSEKHAIPSYTFDEFARWTEDILKDAQRDSWTFTSVRKGEQFEFIHAETNGFAIRQAPELFMLGFTPKSPGWREDLKQTTLSLLKANVQGEEWDSVRVSSPQKVGEVTFLETVGGFPETWGTTRNAFVAVALERQLWICLPKRLALGGPLDYGFFLGTNKRWLSMRRDR